MFAMKTPIDNGSGMGQRHVVITARSVITGGLCSVEDLWGAVMAETRLPDELPELEMLAGLARLEAPDVAILSRHQLLALAVTERAWSEAGLSSHRNRLRGEGVKHRLPRIGCVSGSSTGGLAAMEEERANQENRVSPYSLTRWRGNSLGAAVSIRHGLGGAEFSLNAASATGAQAISLAGILIRSGVMDAAVVVVAEPNATPQLRESMNRSGSVSRNPENGPLSAGRSGMRPVEGAACLILESREHASRRGARILARWLGGGCEAEAHHLLAPEPNAVALRGVIAGIDSSGVIAGGIDRVDWISLHATGTPRFDSVEAACIRSSFGGKTPWISAFKRITGHALGASGLIEALLLVEGLMRGEVPPWPRGIDPSLGLVAPATAPKPVVALQIGQGMGGVVAVNAFAGEE
jgi:3-oxoacyl-(acyl-carrier-protein) synthase